MTTYLQPFPAKQLHIVGSFVQVICRLHHYCIKKLGCSDNAVIKMAKDSWVDFMARYTNKDHVFKFIYNRHSLAVFVDRKMKDEEETQRENHGLYKKVFMLSEQSSLQNMFVSIEGELLKYTSLSEAQMKAIADKEAAAFKRKQEQRSALTNKTTQDQKDQIIKAAEATGRTVI